MKQTLEVIETSADALANELADLEREAQSLSLLLGDAITFVQDDLAFVAELLAGLASDVKTFEEVVRDFAGELKESAEPAVNALGSTSGALATTTETCAVALAPLIDAYGQARSSLERLASDITATSHGHENDSKAMLELVQQQKDKSATDGSAAVDFLRELETSLGDLQVQARGFTMNGVTVVGAVKGGLEAWHMQILIQIDDKVSALAEAIRSAANTHLAAPLDQELAKAQAEIVSKGKVALEQIVSLIEGVLDTIEQRITDMAGQSTTAGQAMGPEKAALEDIKDAIEPLMRVVTDTANAVGFHI